MTPIFVVPTGRWSVPGCIPTIERGNDKFFIVPTMTIRILDAAEQDLIDGYQYAKVVAPN